MMIPSTQDRIYAEEVGGAQPDSDDTATGFRIGPIELYQTSQSYDNF